MKKVHEMSPAMDVLHTGRLNLYQDDRHRLCQAETDDTNPESRDANDKVWSTSVGMIDSGRRIAIKYYKNKRKKRRAREPKPRTAEWAAPSVWEYREAL